MIDATNQEFQTIRDELLLKIKTGTATRPDEIIAQACHKMLYYHSFGTNLSDVQTWLTQLRDFLRDTICGYEGYVRIRPEVVNYVVKLTEYLNGLEKQSPFEDVIP